MSEKIERRILRDFGFSVPVFLRTAKELEEIIERNPFLTDTAIDRSKLHITFLSDAAPKTTVEELQPLAVKPEQFRVMGRQIYLYCPNGYGRTRLSNTAIEKKLSVRATTRNWKTVNTLLSRLIPTLVPESIVSPEMRWLSNLPCPQFMRLPSKINNR